MNICKSISAVACVLLCAYSIAANAAEADKPVMQHYVFKYNFNKRVDPVHKQMQEVQQQIQHDVALDVLFSAHNSLSSTYEELAMMLAKQQSDKNESESTIAE